MSLHVQDHSSKTFLKLVAVLQRHVALLCSCEALAFVVVLGCAPSWTPPDPRSKRRQVGESDILTLLYYTILYYTILYYTILYYTILYYSLKGALIGNQGISDLSIFFQVEKDKAAAIPIRSQNHPDPPLLTILGCR